MISPTTPPLPEFQSRQTATISPVPLDSSHPEIRGVHAHLLKALEHLRAARLSPTKFILEILASDSSDAQLHHLRNQFFREDHGNVPNLLDALWSDAKGRTQVQAWMVSQEVAVELVEQQISEEFENVKPTLYMKSSQISIPYIENWDVCGIIDSAPTPTFTRILRAAIDEDGKYHHQPNKQALERNKIVTVPFFFTTTQTGGCWTNGRESVDFARRSRPLILGTFSWANGTSNQVMDLLNRAGLTTSADTVANTVINLGNRSITEAIDLLMWFPHALGYDNFHLTMSTFVEQKPGAPQKVQTGTFPLVYRLFNANFHDMKIKPIQERLKHSNGLNLTDTMPTIDQATSYYHQFLVHIIRVLPKYVAGFAVLYPDNHPLLQHHPRRALPHDHKTDFSTLRMCLIEEATVIGNIHQLTLARTRSAQRHRRMEKNSWERREIFQLGIGLFHLCMNFIWVLLHSHRGAAIQPGSLSFFFSILEKKRLGSDKPDYHTLLVALQQIVDGLLLYAWKCECGLLSLSEFAHRNPSSDTLLTMAKAILHKYRPLSPSILTEKSRNRTDGDIIQQNTCKLIRDLLYMQELVRAISDGDFGRIEDLFPDLARMFRGAGSNNYCIEILHFLHSVKRVWSPAFA
ncbi:hypothetical protein K435DRAFT_663977 [Dendrothele bispora CBS 962.96]|uniref:DUF6589 domain-containing protein n=1 Tax=Dendrothele bispora (strain CBS 962.96) TaxID=1314807 RepID=A0A4S8M3I5_DENBC|nr:hypothetical protein K435DRAFT_663977 [Dendrothele bispora CBS 962.96]